MAAQNTFLSAVCDLCYDAINNRRRSYAELRKIKKAERTLGFAAAMVTVLLWASAFPASRYALAFYSPGSVMLLRFFVASVTMVIIAAAKGIKPPKLRDVPKFAAGGLVGIFSYMFFFNTGSVYVESGVSSFIIASLPVFAIILSRLLLGERVSLIGWIGVAVSFGGLAVITLTQVAEFELNKGIPLLVMAAISGSIHNIIQRKLLKIHTALETTTYSIIAATIFMLIFLPGFIRELPGSTMSVNLVTAYLGVFPAALAYLSWGYALSKAEKTTHVTVFLYLVPFIAIIIAYFWLRETLSIWSFVGGIVIIAGMVLTNLARTKRGGSG